MPARRCGKSQLSIAREGFLDRRSKRCFWLLLSPQTKVARAGARNYPRRRQRKRSRRGAKLSPSETNTTLAPLRGGTLSTPFGGTCLPAGRFAGLTRHRRVIQYRGPPGGRLWGVSFSNTDPARGRPEGCGGRSETRLPWRRQAAASASAPVNAGTVLLSDNDDKRLCPREDAGNHSRP